MDKIIIKDARFLCNVGVSPEERKKKQEINIDIEIFLDIKKASQSDDIMHTINYSEVYNLLKNLIEKNRYRLIETITENIANKILKEFSIKKILVRIKKPLALRNAKYTAVEIIRRKK